MLRRSQLYLYGFVEPSSGEVVWYGYRRIHVFLKREGWQINHKRTYKLYCEEGLQMRNKTPKRRVSARLS